MNNLFDAFIARRWPGWVGALTVLAGCATSPSVTPRKDVENRMGESEARVQALPMEQSKIQVQSLDAQTPLVIPRPYQSKAELRAHIDALLNERAEFLRAYTPQHPDIRDIDRQIRILEQQILMLEGQSSVLSHTIKP